MNRRRVTVIILSLLAVLVLLTCLKFFETKSRNRDGQEARRKEEKARSKDEAKSGASVSGTPTIGAANSTNRVGRIDPKADPRQVEAETVLRALKRWAKQKDGKDVEVVDAQKIYDMDGKPASMNVLVTTRLGGLTAEKLKEQLDANAARERDLREQLHKAYQEGDVAAVNRLVAELSESRTAFITTNEVTSYKVSLSKERPPVLAFWPGLPFETVREDAARSLAATKLGDDIGLQGLIHYTSATALLCFTNNTGGSIYVDPFRIAEVPFNLLQSARGRSARADDDGRESRIAAQWEEFLGPESSNANN